MRVSDRLRLAFTVSDRLSGLIPLHQGLNLQIRRDATICSRGGNASGFDLYIFREFRLTIIIMCMCMEI